MINYSDADSFVVEGKLALPYRYFAGRIGSKFLVTLRDEKKILGSKCARCNKIHVPPRSACEQHLESECSDWVELPGTGKVECFTIIRYSEPHHPMAPPWIQALIRLDGADGALVHIIKGIEPEAMCNGLKVKAVFSGEKRSTLMAIDHFAPLGDPSAESSS